MADVFELGVIIKAFDYFSGPLRSMVSSISAAQGKFAGLNNTMKMMGKSTAEIEAINSALNKMNDQKAFSNMANDLSRVGMARSEIDAMEGSYMRMAQYQRDMAAAQTRYNAGSNLVATGSGNLMTGALGAAGIFEMLKQADQLQSNMTVIQDSTGATTKQMNEFSDAVMKTSSQVAMFNDLQISKMAQQLTSGGFSKIKQAQSVLPVVAKYAETQMLENKASDPTESTKQAIEMAHLYGHRDPKSFEKFLNDFNKYSLMQPGDSTQLEQTMKYLAPTANMLHMSQSSSMALAAVDNTLGLSGSHGGTNSADMIMRLIPGLIGGSPTKKKTPRAWAAMEELGFIDKKGNSTFFDKKGGIVDAHKMLSTMINDSKKFNPMQLTGLYKDIFGIQGGRAAGILSSPKSLEQLETMQRQLSHTKSMEQINNDIKKSPYGQLKLLGSNSMTAMLRIGQQLGQSLNPAIVKFNDLLKKMLDFSKAHPAFNKIIGDLLLFAVGGKLAEGVVKIFAGNVKMLSAAFKMIRIRSAAGELTKFGKIVKGLKSVFSPVGNAVKSFASSLGKGLLSSLRAVGSGLKILASGFGRGLLAGIKAIGSGLKLFGSGALTVVKVVARFGTALLRLGVQAAAWAIRMAASWLIALGPVGWIIAGVTAVIAAGVAAWMTNFFGFRDKMIALWNWIKGNWKTLALAAINPVGTVIALALSLLPNKAKQWGMNIMQGLVNGIKSMFGNVVGTVKSIGSAISSTFKSMLGIHSPSKLFMEHGMNIVKGLSLGIEQNSGMANKSTENLAKGVNGSFKTKNSNPGNTGTSGNNQSTAPVIFQSGAIVINPYPGQSRQDVSRFADELMKEIGRRLRNEGFRSGNKPVMGW